MTTLKQLRQEANKHGAELDIDLDYGTVECWLIDDSKQWYSSGAQCAIVSYGYKERASLLYSDALELIIDGVK